MGLLWFGHTDVNSIRIQTKMSALSTGDISKDHCFTCGLSLMEISFHDTRLCEAVEVISSLDMAMYEDIKCTVTVQLLLRNKQTSPST